VADLREIVQASIAGLREVAAQKGVTLEGRMGPAPAYVWADVDRLQQAIANIVQNALKFTPGEGRVDVHLSEDAGAHVVVVKDTGRGIAADFLPLVFMPFAQAESGTTRSYGGLGLGLAIVRHIAEHHGGSVEAHSEGEGKGTTVVLRLPRTPLAVAPAVRPRPMASRPLEEKRILLVDDEPDALELMSEMLSRAGARCRVASSADEALRLLDDSWPDVVVSDLGMAGKDGYELIRAIRERGAADGGDVPAVALSAHAGDEDKRRAERAGYDLHVAKPVRPDDLIGALGRLAHRTTARSRS
jgi:CheY-like chemotaxis protein